MDNYRISQSTGTTTNKREVVINQDVFAKSTSKSYNVGGTIAVNATGIDANIVTTFNGSPLLKSPKPTKDANKYTLVGIAINFINEIAAASRTYTRILPNLMAMPMEESMDRDTKGISTPIRLE